MMIDHIASLDAENRETVLTMTLCDPVAGSFARMYLETFTHYRGTTEHATRELIAWLILAREACGIEGVGHA